MITLLLLANLVIGISLAKKLAEMQTFKVMEFGGYDNYARVVELYQSSGYSKYFENEINLLEKRVLQYSGQAE